MDEWAGVVIAAGQGQRMRSRLSKPLHRICGKEMIRYPVDLLKALGIVRIAVVASPEPCGGLAGQLIEGPGDPAFSHTPGWAEQDRGLTDGAM